jgi:hypothetical protein
VRPKAEPPAQVVMDIRWLKLQKHDAEAEITALPLPHRDKALAQLRRFSTYSKTQFRIKPTYVEGLFEAKLGELRLLFVYGKNSVTWCIGGFVKTDTAHGNRKLESYGPVAQVARNL